MSTRRIIVRSVAFTAALGSAFLFGQAKRSVPTASGGNEFPVTMRQNVVAGKTPVGTKVEAKLIIATLADGVVIPIGATFSGEVTESSSKSLTGPSRLAVRMDSVHWKEGSVPIKVYLTAWYYPLQIAKDDAPSDYGLGAPLDRPRSGHIPSAPDLAPVPGRSLPNGPDIPRAPTSNISDNRVVMKDVESTRHDDGAVTLSSRHVNIKLDRTTTYVLAADGLTPAK